MRPSKPPIIAILSWNKVDLLRRCLKSIEKNTRHPYEVCVLDQASTDGTRNYLKEIGDRVHHVANEKNLGFVLGNNLIMDRFPDRDIVLLNNDTEVTEGWLEALAKRAYSDESIGVVGGKLVFPNGRLQTAGCEIFADASGREIGKHDDPDRRIYNVVADVDYCSGACLYLKRSTLDRIGGFDPQFAPAYWEDTDLCFSCRKAGLRVVYEPACTVIHHEGGSFGAPGQKSRSRELQERNKPKFVAKWREELTGQRSNVFEIPPAEGKEKILVVLPFLPIWDRAAGEMRWWHTLRILNERYQVVLLARNGQDGIKYINPLEEEGITVFHTDTEKLRAFGCDMVGPLWIDFPQLLRSNDFRAVIIGFYHMAAQYEREVRAYAPQAVFIIDSYDVAFLRERRRAELSGSDEDLWHAEEIRRIELDWYRKADMVLTVTERDREVLLAEDPSLRVGISTDIHPLAEERWNPDRKDLVFIGNYKHQPNEDAVIWFTEEILPRIHAELPEAVFRIVGNGPTPAVEALAGDRVEVTGFVPDIVPYLQNGRVCVVPLRYGAGLKGKVGQAMAAGIPQVSTSVGVEGMGMAHERDVLVADDPESFAREVIRLYRDEELQRRIAASARDLVARRYGVENARRYWEEVFEAIDAGRPEPVPAAEEEPERGYAPYRRIERLPAVAPNASIIVPVYNNLHLTRNLWTSVRKNTAIPHELLIVDNGSQEPVKYDAEQNNIRCIRNEENRGFAAAVNQGIRNTYGDYLVILNNDCIVPPGWLGRMIAHLEEDREIGILAPLTNFAATEQQIPVPYKNEEGLYRFAEDLHRRNAGRRKDHKKVVGMCMVIPRRVIDEVGLFDERFGIGNFEDDDICLRVRLAGYRVAVAEDVFIHHEGGATFKAMNVDYQALLKRNGELFLKKWAPVLGGGVGAASSAPRAAETPPVILFQDGPDVPVNHVQETLQTLPKGTPVRILATDPGRFRSLMNKGYDVKAVRPEDLFRRIDREIRTADATHLLVLSTRVRTGRKWTEELIAAAAAERRGIVVPASDEGPPAQRIRAEFPSSRSGVQKQTDLCRRRFTGGWRETGEFAGWALLVDRRGFILAGGLSSEFRSGAVWSDLAARMSDHGWITGVAPGAFVHFSGAGDCPSVPDGGEMEAVLRLAEANELFAGSDLERAMRAVELSLDAKKDYTHALYCRALFLAGEGRVAEAEADLKRVLEINPGFSRAHNNLGCLAFEKGEPEEAERHFREALAVDPGNGEIGRNLGDFYLSTGALQKAMDLYQDLVRRNPKDPNNYLDLGAWFEKLGDAAGARDWYAQALKVDPRNREARERLVTLAGAGAGGGDER
ncbi:MAG: glycosyltransferase [Candidatus Eisenbacteria bacterium]|nr:glycosyltransferase [Candidatus Eisenbacteria bacterium]